MKRLAVLLASCALFLLVSEGALSLLAGRSWTTLGRKRGFLAALDDPRVQADSDRFLAAARTPGPYRVHEDPLVGYAFKAETEVTYLERTFRTDGLGLRLRPGPPPAPGALRLVFLGDSVAFGQGLDDELVIAAQVERLLGERGVRAACSTVAVPSWNVRNAVRFLLDHLEQLAPDLVLFMDVPNDLDDSYGVNEAGQRRKLEDPGVPHPRLCFGPEYTYLAYARRQLALQGIEVDETRCGPDVFAAALSPSARWRLDDAAGWLAHMAERLERIGARLVLLPYEQHALHRMLRARLLERGCDVPSIPLLDKMLSEDTQGDDPHPSAETVRDFALWTVAALLERGWLPDPGTGVPGAPTGSRAQRRGVELEGEALLVWSREHMRSVAEALEPVLSTATLQGMRQLYGGLNLDGTFGVELAALLPPGKRLAVELAPLELRPDLLPLSVRVHVDECELGTLTLPAGSQEPVRAVLELPEPATRAPYDVRLEALDWCIVRIRGQSLVASARLVELASLE